LADKFYPSYFDADEWVELAKNAGMKYIIFTAKHHDGFAMYNSQVSSYNIVKATPFGRDVLREIAKACKKHEVKLGIYYSHCLDWHEENAADPNPDTPLNFGMSWGNDWDYPDRNSKNFAEYFENKVKAQIKELLTEYGPIFLLWFDCALVINKEQCQDLYKLVHSIQPDCLINSRIGHGMGDFESLGDNQSPAGQTNSVIESPHTLNQTWGFKYDDHAWTNATKVVCDLAALSDKNVNYLLNISPRPDGRFPDASADILREVAEWRLQEDVAIQNTSPNPFPQAFPWGWCTLHNNTLQLFIRDWQEKIILNGLRNKIVSCTIPFVQKGELIKLSLPKTNESILAVIKIKFEGELNINGHLMPQNGILELAPAAAKLFHGSPETSHNANSQLGAAAELLAEEDKCSINSSGSLTQWHHAGDAISWPVYFSERGTYEISALTESRCHSASWVGGRKVAIQLSKHTVVTELNADEVIKSPYYSKAISKLACIKINSVGKTYNLTLKNLAISDSEAVNMNLSAIIIKKVKSSDQRLAFIAESK